MGLGLLFELRGFCFGDLILLNCECNCHQFQEKKATILFPVLVSGDHSLSSYCWETVTFCQLSWSRSWRTHCCVQPAVCAGRLVGQKRSSRSRQTCLAAKIRASEACVCEIECNMRPCAAPTVQPEAGSGTEPDSRAGRAAPSREQLVPRLSLYYWRINLC